MTRINWGRITPKNPAWKEGWDERNHTYNGCYAIKRGDKIFVNTGVITFVGKGTKDTKPYRIGGVSEKEFAERTAELKQKSDIRILTEKGNHGTLKRLMFSVPDWKPIKGASVYTDEWLKERFPKKYEDGWRMHPKQGLLPPESIKPTRPEPKICTSCETKKFHFVATGINKPTFWWECNKCGVLYKAR